MRSYYCTPACPLRTMVIIGAALDRAPRPYTATELSEITGVPLTVVVAFLKSNREKEKVSSRSVPRRGGGKPFLEYWRGQQSITDTFEASNMMDNKTENRLKAGERPVSWRDGNHTNWSIDETDTVAMMRGGTVVRLGKAEAVTFSKRGVTIRVKDSVNMTFRRN